MSENETVEEILDEMRDKKLRRQKNRGWDECDPIATAILALIRAQNIVQSVLAAGTFVDVPHAKYDMAYAIRENAIQQFIAATQGDLKRQRALQQWEEVTRRRERVCARRRLIRLAAENGKEVP